MSTVVNSWNEWDPLKHVIVGRADDCHIPPEEPALDAKVPEDSDMRGQWGRRPQETIDRANELLDNFAAQLQKRGIRVDRPTPTDFSLPVTTPDFHTDSQFGCMPPRDVLLTVGSEILEATMSYRCRWFEYLSYRGGATRVHHKPERHRMDQTPFPGSPCSRGEFPRRSLSNPHRRNIHPITSWFDPEQSTASSAR